MASELSDSTVPRLVEGINLASLPLTPKEGFFITRIDGMTGFGDLCSMTGLPADSAREVLEKLRREGAVCWDGAEATEAPAAATTASLDSKALAEQVDLDNELKELILQKHTVMAGQNHYEVLEVERRATVKEIKQAYRRLAAAFHPDRFFRRDIGSYRVRLEAICLRLREAHTVLTDERARRLYDDKLFVAPRLKKRKTQRSRARKKARLEAHPVMQKIKKGREYYQAAVEASKQGDVLKADASLKLAIACDPQRQEYRDLAEALQVAINQQKARKVFERAKDAALMEGVSEALTLFRKAKEMDPEEPEFLIKFAEYSAEHGGSMEEAAAAARRAVFRSGGKAVYRQTFAQLLERLEKYDEAYAEYEKLTDDPETAAFALERLAELGSKTGKKKKKKKMMMKKKKSLF